MGYFLLLLTVPFFSFSTLNNELNYSIPPKTILFSASPEQIIKDAELWKENGVNAFFLDFIAREWSDNIWANDKKPWTIGKDDDNFKKAAEANNICKRTGSETFLKISFDHYLDWFDDLQWENVLHNFRQFAIFARETGCTGFAIDIEYIGEQYHLNWEGYKYDTYTRKDLINKVKERSADLINTIYNAFPKMVFLTFPEQGLNLGLIIHLTWIEELAKKNAPGGLHYCIEHTYRMKDPDEVLTYMGGIDQIFLTYLSPRGKKYWKEKCSIAPGIWPFGYDYDKGHKAGFTTAELKQLYALHISASKKYHWIYSHNCYEQLLGRQAELFEDEEPLQNFVDILKRKESVLDSSFKEKIDLLQKRDFQLLQQKTNFTYIPFPVGPDDSPRFQTAPLHNYEYAHDYFWEIGKKYLQGKEVSFRSLFNPITHWKIAGPFHAENFKETHEKEFPPETDINTVDWKSLSIENNKISMDLNKIFGNQEEICVYALCTIDVLQPVSAQIRFGYNDAIKVWLINGKKKDLIFEYFGESSVVPDKTVIPVSFDKGTYNILMKVTNNKRFWGYILRITDAKGNALPANIIKY
ncbi:MAG: hypothetical protein ACP5UA_03970 [Candidatus Hydrogenedens sp.]